MLLMSSMEIFVMYILIFPNKLGSVAFPCKFIQDARKRSVGGALRSARLCIIVVL